MGSKKITDNIKSSRFKIISLAAIIIFTILLFSNSINNEILYGWDDGEYIENEDVQNFRIKNIFSDYYLGMYQPLAVTSLSINYKISGLNSSGYHGTNLFIHLINIFLVFILFSIITRKFEIVFIVTLLFAIHPMHVETVSWIATRSNGLYSMFYLAAIILYMVYLEKKSYKWLVFSFLFFLFSCFSKSMAVTLPLILLLFDYYLKNKITRRMVFEKIPFFIVSIIFGIISINAAGEYGHIKNLNFDYNILDRIVLIIYSFIFYIVKAIGPANLSAVYAYPAKSGAFLAWNYYFGVLIFIVLIYNVVKSGSLKNDIVFGLLFYLISISVVLPIVWSRMLMLADRYTYIPYLGLFFIIAKLYEKIAKSKHPLFRKYNTYLAAVFIIFLLFLSVTTFQRNKVWKNAETLVTDVIEKNRSDNDVAIGYFFRGNIRDRDQDYQGALEDFTKAINLNPYYTMAYNNRGILKGSVQDLEGALLDFNKAIELEPNYADARYNRGNVFYYLNQQEKACEDWEKAEEFGSKQAVKILRKYCR